MFNLFKKKSEGKEPDENDGLDYDASTVKVSFNGEVISSEYAERSLVIVHNKLREEFNDQDYLFHMLLPHGKGKIKYTDPRLAEENQDEGLLEEYEGEFDGGQYHGQGKLIFRTGEILEGEFKENKFVEKKENTSGEYKGEKRDGKFHGKGKLIDENGDVYEGDFQLGEFHGQGKYIINDDVTCEGKWVRGKLIEGSIKSKSENILYEGEIKDFKRHGKGTFYNYREKTKFVGFWEEGKLSDSVDDWECDEIE